MRRRRTNVMRGGLVCLALTSMAALLVSPAVAHEMRVHDPNDTAGPFDIASVTTDHDHDRVNYTITTFSNWKTSALDISSDRFFVFVADLDMRSGDPKPFERCVFVFSAPGLTAVMTNCGRSQLNETVLVRRVGRDGVDISMDPPSLGTHLWAIASSYGDGPCHDVCFDAVPRKGAYLHDLVAPVARAVGGPEGMSTQYWTTTSIPLTIEVSDDEHGSGVDRWYVETRPIDGAASWTVALSGSGEGTFEESLDLEQGDAVDYRVYAVDRQENSVRRLLAPRFLVVPLDDTAVEATYPSGTTVVEDPSAYLGSYRSIPEGSTAAIPISSPVYVVWVGDGSGTWSATVELDDGLSTRPLGTVSSANFDDAPRQTLFISTGPFIGDSTLLIHADSGAVPIDAFGGAGSRTG